MSKKRRSTTPEVKTEIIDQHYVVSLIQDGEVVAMGRGDLPAIARQRAFDAFGKNLPPVIEEPEPEMTDEELSELEAHLDRFGPMD